MHRLYIFFVLFSGYLHLCAKDDRKQLPQIPFQLPTLPDASEFAQKLENDWSKFNRQYEEEKKQELTQQAFDLLNNSSNLVTCTPEDRNDWFHALAKVLTTLNSWPYSKNFSLPAYLNPKILAQYIYYTFSLKNHKINYITRNDTVTGIVLPIDNNVLVLSAKHPEHYTFVSPLDFDAWPLDDRMDYINYLIESGNNKDLLQAFRIRCKYLIPGTLYGGLIGLASSPLLIELLPKKLKSKIEKYPLARIALMATLTVTGCIIGQSIEHMYRFRHTETKC